MNLKNQLLSVVFILIINILSIFPTTILLFLAENGDQAFLTVFGIANVLFLKFRLKINLLTSFILGFLNVAISIYVTYLIMYFSSLSDGGKLLPYLLITLSISWIYIKTKWERFNLKKFNLILILPVLILSWSSYQIKRYYQPKTEKENLTQVEFKIPASNKNPKQSDSVEVRIRRNPLFGLRETKRVDKKAVDKNGVCKFILSKNHDYQINVNYSDDKYDFEEITSRDLKIDNKFIIPR